MEMGRRSFLKKMLIGVGVTVLAGSIITRGKNPLSTLSSSTDSSDTTSDSDDHGSMTAVPDDPERHWGFLIDLSKCNGCVDQEAPDDDPTGEKPQCTYACRQSHYYTGADPPQYWIYVYLLTETPSIPAHYFPKPCQNCQNAPCKKVCPTKATFQRKDGTVLIDHRLCIGCRLCIAACPYETRYFWYNNPPPLKGELGDRKYSPEYPIPYIRGTVVKCDLCVDRAYNGLLPTCVLACPRGAIYYGDLNENAVSNSAEIVSLQDTLDNKAAYRYKEDVGTFPSVYYLPPLRNTGNTKLQSQLEVEIGDQLLSKDLAQLKIKATTKNGSRISGAKIIVRRDTAFGQSTIGEGKTGSDGTFTCSFLKSKRDTLLTAELVESEQYSRSVMKKHIRTKQLR